MGANTKIEWTDASMNFWQGCHKVSQGCKNCYMFTDKKRYGQDANTVSRCGDATFYAALKWKEPKKIFTCSWSDFFIEEADEWRADAWDVIRRTPHHTWQILTKRPERIADHLPPDWGSGWDNVWLGTSAEDQKALEKRMEPLLKVRAAVHFLSAEPLLGDLNLSHINLGGWSLNALRGEIRGTFTRDINFCSLLDWVIAGGESGPNARPMHPEWARSLRDQCVDAGVAFHFKQHGEYLHESQAPDMVPPSKVFLAPDTTMFYRVGKKAAGRLLDGRTWDEFPIEVPSP